MSDEIPDRLDPKAAERALDQQLSRPVTPKERKFYADVPSRRGHKRGVG